MPGPAEVFRKLHHLRRHATDLSSEIDRGPKMLKAHEAKHTKQEEALREAQEVLKRAKVAVHEKEVSLKTKEAQIAKYQTQMSTASSTKEYEALKKEIAHERQDCKKIEDEILEKMDEVERRTTMIPELEKSVEAAKKQTYQIIDDIQSRRNDLTDRLAQVLKEIEATEALLPEEVKPNYERLVGAMGADALAVVEGRGCGTCYTEITSQNRNDLLQGKMMYCRSCGRILYLPE